MLQQSRANCIKTTGLGSVCCFGSPPSRLDGGSNEACSDYTNRSVLSRSRSSPRCDPTAQALGHHETFPPVPLDPFCVEVHTRRTSPQFAHQRVQTTTKIRHEASRFSSGVHPLVYPMLMAAVARASCSRMCRTSSIRVSIAARWSPSCQATRWATGSATGSFRVGRTFSISGFEVQFPHVVVGKHAPFVPAMFYLCSCLIRSQERSKGMDGMSVIYKCGE